MTLDLYVYVYTKFTCIYILIVILKILPPKHALAEDPKYTIALRRLPIDSLGTYIGLTLEPWSANTCTCNSNLSFNRILLVVIAQMDFNIATIYFVSLEVGAIQRESPSHRCSARNLFTAE